MFKLLVDISIIFICQVHSYVDYSIYPEYRELRKEIIFNTENYVKLSHDVHIESSKHNIDPNLIRATIIVESKFNPNAGSNKGALGLMQLMPRTAKSLDIKDRANPRSSIKGGVRYLKQLLKRFDNNKDLALAAFNAGPTVVSKYKGIPPYKETISYVKQVSYIQSRLNKADSKLEFFYKITLEKYKRVIIK